MPVRQITGNLLWCTDGTVWAAFRVEAVGGAYPSRDRMRDLLAGAEAVVKNLPPGEVMLASLCPQVDAAQIVRAMIDGIDLSARPEWVQTAEAVLDQLDDIEMTGRTHWLLVPLDRGTGAAAVRTAVRAAVGGVGRRQGGRPVPVPSERVAAARVRADRIVGALPGGVGLRPATEAELVWWITRAPRRGLDEPVLRDSGVQDTRLRDVDGSSGVGLAAFEDVVLDEGGRTDDLPGPADGGVAGLAAAARRRVLGPVAGLRRRWVKVITEGGSSYQALLTVAQMPRVFGFPGSAWLGRVDGFGFPVDWVVRLRIVPNEAARRKNRRQARELAAQWDEHGEDGPPVELGEAVAELDEQGERLAASTTEVEVQATVIFSVWGDSPAVTDARAQALRTGYGAGEFALARPVGHQIPLYLAMLPGSASPPVVGDYTQFLLARDFAMAMPWMAAGIGDPTGGLLGFSLDGNGPHPVLYDPSYGPRIGASASAAVCAELGGGKSVWLKKTWFEVLARLGGRVVAVDRTPVREYVRFAAACPGVAQVVEVSQDATISLDPLRVFTGKVAIRHAETFYARWLDLSPRSPHGLVLAEAIEAVVNAGTPSSARLCEELDRRGSADPVARDLARQLRLMARRDLARLVFDDTLPALDVSGADSIVFATAEIPMPTREELASEYQATRLPFAKAFGRAVHVLIAAISREVAFADPRFTAVIWDECYSVTCSPEGEQLILETVRDGRKHNAGAFLGGHDPEADFGSPTLRGLIAVRLLGRHRDVTLARRGLTWMDLDDDPHLVDLVTTGLSPLDLPAREAQARRGEFLFRDTRRRVGRVKILIPPYQNVPRAILTDPGA